MNGSAAPGVSHAGGMIPHIFLKIPEIKGEARSKGHDAEIEIASWSWGETQTVFPSESRKSGGSVNMRDVQFTAITSAASAQFLLHCAAAKKLKSVVLTCEHDTASGRHKYLTVTLTNVVLSSYEIEGSGNDNHATDRVTLKFTKIEFAYTPFNGSNFSCTWDLDLNTK